MRPEDVQMHLRMLKDQPRTHYGPWLDVAISMVGRLGEVESAAFEAHDCLGGEDEIRAILARVCDPK